METNLLLDTDSYRQSHHLQLPPGTIKMRSYGGPRVGSQFDEIVANVGLQLILEELAQGIRIGDVYEAEAICREHGVPFNRRDWIRVCSDMLGRLPISIRAIPEGTVVPPGTATIFIEGTKDWFPGAASFFETKLLRNWYPPTVATLARECKKVILRYLDASGDPSSIDFKLVDFGSRGVPNHQTSAEGGFGHLVNFKATDNLPAIMLARRHYGEMMAGFSIPAAEHATVTSWGRDNEAMPYANMIEQFGGEGKMYAVVSDSYDLDHAVKEIWGKQLKEQVLAKGGTLVVRPDSGKPEKVVLDTVRHLDQAFGSTENAKGFKVLHPAVRVIQGDGINLRSIESILFNLVQAGYSADNVSFGMGGGLLQGVTRDTCAFALKCSQVEIGFPGGPTKSVDVQKDPATDPNKKSMAGHLCTVKRQDGSIKTIRVESILPTDTRLDVEVFRDGHLLRPAPTLAEIRARAAV